MVKPGSKDRKASILITGMELDELQLRPISISTDNMRSCDFRHNTHLIISIRATKAQILSAKMTLRF